MKYFVKNEHGELTFGSIHELRAMFEQGMVDGDDDVRAEDSKIWRKAAAVPELRDFAASRQKSSPAFPIVALVCLSLALYVLIGRTSLSYIARLFIAAALVVPVIGMSQRAFRKNIKRERK